MILMIIKGGSVPLVHILNIPPGLQKSLTNDLEYRSSKTYDMLQSRAGNVCLTKNWIVIILVSA